MSREEFERLPEGPPYYDYIDGEAIEVNRPSLKHQEIQLEVAGVVKRFAKSRSLGQTYHKINVQLPQGNWISPDVVFVATNHLDRIDDERKCLYGSPDLVIEISSPSTWGYDRIEKMNQYHLARVPWVWIIEQESLTIEENQWTPEGYVRIGGAVAGHVFRPRLFPELEVDLKALMGY
jgi:Uma2 family endonuclease